MRVSILKTSFLLILLLSAGSCLLAQTSAVVEIRRMLDDQTASWNQGNLDAFLKDYWNNDSLIFVGKKGITYGYQNTLRRYKASYFDREQMGNLAFDILHINKISEDYHSVVGRYRLKRKVGDVEGYYTLLIRKIQGRWVIVSDHSS